MAPLIFRAVALLVAIGGALTALFPKQMQSFRMRGPGRDTTVEPTRVRLLFARLVGVVVALVGAVMAFGDPSVLL